MLVKEKAAIAASYNITDNILESICRPAQLLFWQARYRT